MPIYRTRRKCGAEDTTAPAGAPGKGKGFHYVEEEVQADSEADLVQNTPCPDHPGAPVTFFILLNPSEVEV